MTQTTLPMIALADLQPVDDGFTWSRTFTWTQGHLIATVYLDTVERDHFQPGHYRRDVYEITTTSNHVDHRALSPELEAQGFQMEDQLRAHLLMVLPGAGWYEIDRTRDNQPIWRYGSSVSTLVLEQKNELARRSRTVYTRAVTFTCQGCYTEVTEQRFPSHLPLYCSNPACKKEATRQKTRARVAAWREAHPDARKKKV